MDKTRVLIYDIETSHNVAAIFRLLNQDMIPHENILKERYMVSVAWKWFREGTPTHVSTILDNPKLFKSDNSNDAHVVTKLHELMSEADIIVAHNGDQYDIKFSETRMLAHNLEPLPPKVKIDTMKIAKDRFLFNSNSLDYIGKFLGFGGKKHTSHGLWLRVLQGDKAAIQEMAEYNIEDVELLEKVFITFLPYIKTPITRQFSGTNACPHCGSTHFQSRGQYYTDTRRYNKYFCVSCRKWFREDKPLKIDKPFRLIS